MGRIILCTSKQAEVPYVFPVSEAKVYTIEELCYSFFNYSIISVMLRLNALMKSLLAGFLMNWEWLRLPKSLRI